MIIRKATEEDAEVAAKLLEELGYSDSVEVVKRRIGRLANTPSTAGFVGVSSDQVVGLVGVHAVPLVYRDGALARVTTLVIAPGHRRKQLGKQLMLACENWARAAGCERLEVTSGLDRTGAHAFYESLGMAPASARFIKWL